MLKVHTDRTQLLKFGERKGQVGQRLGSDSMRELRETFDNIRENRFRGTWKSKLTTEVPNGEDDVLPQPTPQGSKDNLVTPRRVEKRNPIKGRSADLIIVDDVLDEPDVRVPAPAPTTKREAIDVGDYIQLDLI